MRGRAWALARRLVHEWQLRGWGEMRTHIGLHDQVAATYDFNDHALLRLNERIKNALDPRGIIAPGKSGMWPPAYERKNWVMGHEFLGEKFLENFGGRGDRVNGSAGENVQNDGDKHGKSLDAGLV
jgi:hypothetical protein